MATNGDSTMERAVEFAHRCGFEPKAKVSSVQPSFVLHLELGASFVVAAVDKFGVSGWNSWNDSLAKLVPGFWTDGESEPALCFWLDLDDADLTHKQWDGISLVLASCRRTRFDHSSLVGAEIQCGCSASFRSSDLRRATLCGDLTSVDFSDATTEGIILDDCTYNEGRPPVGLPAELLLQCRPVPVGEPVGSGVTEYPVPITASLAKAWVPR